MLKDILLKYNIFSLEELQKIVPLFEFRRFQKGGYFVNVGEYSNTLAIVQKGILRGYFLGDGKEHTYCFRSENQPLASYSSYLNGSRSEKAIQAITDVQLWTISKTNADRLEKEYPNWSRFMKMIIDNEYRSLEIQRREVLEKTSAERYQTIEEKFPEYFKNIPLQYIASYMGITQRHLSRIRSF